MSHHSKRCLAEAVISAVQNARDNTEWSDGDFRYWAEGSGPYDWGIQYLDEGLQTCTCHVGAIKRVQERYDLEGAQAATDLAASYLQKNYITTGDYMNLVKWSENRD